MSQDSRIQKQAQAQALEAWKWVAAAGKQSESARGQYATLARKLPSYLQVSGLGQTMAFLYSKSKGNDNNAYGLLFTQLGEYLRPYSSAKTGAASREDKLHRYMELIVQSSREEYRSLTKEAMSIADWVKRFAAGQLGEGMELDQGDEG